MNVLSSLLNFIADTIGNVSMGTSATTLKGAIAETYKRTRSVYGKGTHTLNRMYGVYGYAGTSGSIYICIPVNVAKDVSSVSFTNLKASLRNVAGGYVYSTSTNMSSLIQSSSVFDKQPIIRVNLTSSDFVVTNNTPIAGEITEATMVLS